MEPFGYWSSAYLKNTQRGRLEAFEPLERHDRQRAGMIAFIAVARLISSSFSRDPFVVVYVLIFLSSMGGSVRLRFGAEYQDARPAGKDCSLRSVEEYILMDLFDRVFTSIISHFSVSVCLICILSRKVFIFGIP